MERQMRENEACESAQIKLLNSELEVQRRKYDSTKKTVEELDDQCEKLMVSGLKDIIYYVFYISKY